MVKVKTRFKATVSLSELSDALTNSFGKKARGNFGDFRPFVKEAVDEAVIDVRFNFIPTDQEAFELGVGAGGNLDTSRTQGAWRQLLTDSNERITTLSIRRDRRKNKIGTITVSVDEEKFLAAELSNVDTPDSDAFTSIPWMKWLIRGAPSNPDFQFSNEVRGARFSRTGGGIMVKGGVWSFPPARLGAFSRLGKSLEVQLIRTIKNNIGKAIL